jgi:transcriptional regulator
MTTQERRGRDSLLQGTLDLLILRTLEAGPEHGQGIARTIEQRSAGSLLVEHGSLYPALQRLEDAGLVRAKWGISSNNRKARFYELTAAGRRQLVSEQERWWRMVDAVGRILQPSEG